MTLFAMIAGARPLWAQTTEEFTSNDWPDEWSLSAEATESDYYIEYDSSNDYSYPSGRRGVYGQVGSGTTKYIITPIVDGSGSFKFKRRNSSNGSVYVYTIDNGVLSSSPIVSNTSKPTSWTTVSFSGVDNSRLAIVLNGRMDDFTYTLGAEVSCAKPNNLSASNVTDESATISWDAGEASTWNLRYKAAGDENYTEDYGLTTNSYALTGLDAATTYTVEVQTVCSVDDQSAWASAEFTTLFCNPSVQKTISYTLTDSYSDGWNGAQITITDVLSGVIIATLTVPSSTATASGTVALCPNREYRFTWTKGNYDSECSYTIKDVDGNDLYTLASGSSPSSGEIGTYMWGDGPVPEVAKFAINTDGTTQNFGTVIADAVAEKTYTVTNSGNADLVVTFTDAADFYVPKTVKFTKPYDWSGDKLYFYAWDASDNALIGAWPGIEVTNAAQNDMGEWVYTTTLPKNAAGIKFSDNASHETSNISTNGFKYIVGYYLNNGTPTQWQNDDLTVAAGGSATFTVKMDTKTPGNKSGNIALAFEAQNANSFTIPCTGVVKDPNVLSVDFSSNAFPEGWQVGADWTVSGGNAHQDNTKTPSALVTTPLTVSEGETLTFKVSRNITGSSSYTKSLKVRYSTDGGVNWSEYVTYNSDNFGSSFDTYSLTGVPAGTVIIEFFGNNIKLDDIEGFRLATAPALAVTESGEAVANGDTKDLGNLSADGTATYTLKNIGNATLTAAITGNGVTVNPATVEIAAGQTADIAVTMAYGEPYGANDWIGDFAVNFTANLVDPTDFVIDFENGKPAGWYDDGWTFSDGTAHINVGTAKSMITEMVGAESGKNTLKFDAKLQYDYGYGTYTLNVSTSTDRKNWTLAKEVTLTADVQNVTLPALADGNYYVKFEAANASVDNIKGVKKLDAPAHDLYLVEATLPTDNITPIDTYTATLKVASLRADENVTAELYFGESKVGETTQTIANGATQTITVSGTAPAGGEYLVYAKVYNNDVAVETEKVTVTVADKAELTLTNFAVVNDHVQADENNNFTAEFNVTVKNTGSTTFVADSVLVTVTDGNNNSLKTASWTPGETIYLKAGNYTEANANFAIYRWSTDTDSEWALFTEGTNGIYSAELNGKTSFIICRVNPATPVSELSFENGVWTQSDNLTTGNGVVFENNGYYYDKLNLIQSNNFLAGMSATFKVAVTAPAEEGGEFSFNAKVGDVFWYPTIGNLQYVTVTAAPAIVLDEAGDGTFETGTNRKVQLKHTFAAGWNTICLPFALNATEIDADAKALAFTDYNADTRELTFAPVTELEANTPYAVYVPTAIISTINFTGKTVVSSDSLSTSFNGVTFQGTYAPTGTMEDWYGLTAAGKIAKASATATLKGFRAYFTGVPAGATARFIDHVSTGINSISVDDNMEGVYNLQGQKVEQLRKGGLYIINGKKIVRK